MNRQRMNRDGFSLIEMAVVIGIIAMILGFAINLGTNAVKSAERVNTQERLTIIKKALDAYANANGYLPCPANRTFTPLGAANFGLEARSGTTCATSGTGVRSISNDFTGAVPVRTLGLPDSYAADAWGSKFAYAVSSSHVGDVTSYNSSNGNIYIATGDLNGSWYIVTYAATYVVLSHGPDKRGAYPLNGSTVAVACASGLQTDAWNCRENNQTYFDSAYNDGRNEEQYFDDYVVWGSNALFRSPASTAQPGCSTGCEAWCATCSGTLPHLPLDPASFTSPKLCKKIITSTTPCAATCLWSGTITAGSTIVSCP